MQGWPGEKSTQSLDVEKRSPQANDDDERLLLPASFLKLPKSGVSCTFVKVSKSIKD